MIITMMTYVVAIFALSATIRMLDKSLYEDCKQEAERYRVTLGRMT